MGPGHRAGLLGTRRVLTQLVVVALLVVAAILFVILDEASFLVGVAVWLVLMTVGLPWLVVRRARKHFARLAFPGARWAIGYGPTSLVLYQPTASAVVDYALFSTVRPGNGNTVLVQYAQSRLMIVLPGELCPPMARDFLTDAVRRRR